MFSPAPPDVVIIVAVQERGEHQNYFHNLQSRNGVGKTVIVGHLSKHVGTRGRSDN